MIDEKQCSICRLIKSTAAFPTKKSGAGGYGSFCRACKAIKSHNWYVNNREKSLANSKRWANSNRNKAVDYHRKSRYGVTPRQYDNMLTAQGGRCAICNRHGNEFKRGLHVDHDHATNKVRALLCGPCNKAIGSFGENTERMANAIQYIIFHTQKEHSL